MYEYSKEDNSKTDIGLRQNKHSALDLFMQQTKSICQAPRKPLNKLSFFYFNNKDNLTLTFVM